MNFYLTALLLGLAYSCLAYGIYISMRIFNIPDITTDGSFTLGGAVTAVLTTQLVNPGLVLPAAFILGALAGVTTGWIHTRLKVNALLAGILVTTGLYSINLALMGRSNIPLINTPSFFSLITLSSSEKNNQLIILAVVTISLLLLLRFLLRTDFGLAMRATGNSETMIRALGLNTDQMKIIGLGLANGLTATCGYLITYVQGYADINMGIGIVILGLGAVMIGEMISSTLKWKSITGQLICVVIGSILFRVILGFTLSIGIDPLYLKLVTAVFVLAVVSLPQLKRTA